MASTEALTERLFESILGMIDVHAVYAGDRLGLYAALADGASTPAEVASATGTDERYVREWLEQQAVSGLIEADDGAFSLPPEHAEVLLSNGGLESLAPFVRMMVGIVRPLPQVLEAFRSGAGVPYATYDGDFCEGQGDMNGAMFDHLLAPEWIAAVPGLEDRLLSEPPAQVCDLACGVGRSTLAIARAFPQVRVHGVDLDERSIGLAREALAAEPELAERVRFDVRDAAHPEHAERFDLVTVFEAVHDLSRPVEVLRAVRGMLAEGGTAVVADERVADAFSAPGDEVERLMYGFSILHCLPVGMAEQPSAATGTVMRAHQLEGYAREAGFSGLEVLPIDNDFWRFYRLLP